MKYFMLLALLVGLLACSDNDDGASGAVDETIEINVSSSVLEFDYEAGQKVLTIQANDEWGIFSSESWCTTTPTGGLAGETDITVSVSKNSSDELRTATLTIKSGSYKEFINVNQAFYVEVLTFDDDEFEKFCIDNFDLNGDDKVSADEVQSITELEISNLGISSLTGIEYFVSLKSLDCSNNNIQELDISKLTMLQSLDCSNNELSELDIRQNVNLSYLNCEGNPALVNIFVWTGFIADGNFYKPDDAVYIEPEIPTPPGYTLVWQDEFNDARSSDGKAAMPDNSRWWYETGDGGWGNNELQKYVAGIQGEDTCAMVFDGTLKIIAKKVGDQVLSIRMNSTESWTYGYFEARLKLPGGKGTWPAFWMLPKNFTAWPDDGEIDIMEEVGYNPNWVSSSIHCSAYNHAIGTQKTASVYVATAESEFHVYAVEWTEDYIKGFVDGEVYFEFYNDHKGDDDTWPFYKPFYLKLNLAWGGDWGGAQGVDESVLPATYEIDYVRVFQKIN